MAEPKNQIVDVGSVVEALSSDVGDAPLYQLDSLCMRCHENGTTKFLFTVIPHFRKILLSAFECTHCGERNNEVQFAGEIQPKGCNCRLEVPAGDPKMLDRQVVKSESATIKIPELEFEIPPEAQRGSLSTVPYSNMWKGYCYEQQRNWRLYKKNARYFISTFISCLLMYPHKLMAN
ncbi:hypothetical protein G4B88_023532 [Cannabis sativa]|uniref:Zinc finger ZPR1-type domain-containing protein n=1 Tax=Cannabis sativa TaxID=3483 RepID=A0A7J6HW47_CANSA|nr:hypothetical protein G4B88_023532 [Cannabis sativa]